MDRVAARDLRPSTAPRSWDEVADLSDLSALSFKQLRTLCNQAFRALDADHPPYGAAACYSALVEELDVRRSRMREPVATRKPRLGFRDNMMLSHFELFDEGVLAGYVRYRQQGGQLILTETVVLPHFLEADLGVEPVLLRHVILEAHHRRLEVTAACPVVRAFLSTYPQYSALVSGQPDQHRRPSDRTAPVGVQ